MSDTSLGSGRSLSRRQMAMLGLGSAIDPGLFLGTGSSVAAASAHLPQGSAA